MVPAVVRALTAARIIGWSVWWSPGLVCHWGAAASGQPLGRLSLGHRHVSLRRLSESLSFLVAVCVVRNWNLVHYFLYASYLAVTFPVCGCCIWSTALDFREILQLLVGAFLGSTVDTCSASVLGVWKNCIHLLRCGRLES